MNHVSCHSHLPQNLTDKIDKRFKEFNINGVKKNLFIDTGCNINLLKIETLIEIAPDKLTWISNNDGMPYIMPYAANKPLEVIAIADLPVTDDENGKTPVIERFYAIKQATSDLIGYNTAEKIYSLEWLKRSNENVWRNIELNFPSVIDPYPAIPNFKLKLVSDPAIDPTVRNFFVMKPGTEEEVKKELEYLLSKGVIGRAKFGVPWVSPMLTVVKPGGGIRICVDMTLVNKAIFRKQYKMPTIEDMTEHAAGHKYFAKFDMEKAFYHIVLDEESRHLTTFYTPYGYFEFLRMPFGLNVAPETFQERVDLIVNTVPGAKAYLDDILVVADSLDELKSRTDQLLEKLKENNLTVNNEKTVYGKTEVEFVGFILSGKGCKLTRDRIEAFEKMKPPKDIKELRSFLGHVVYLQSFIPRASDVASPLWELLRSRNFMWGKRHKNAFCDLKRLICEDTMKNHFKSGRKTLLITDASPDALACCLVQIEPGTTRPLPIAFASTLLKGAQLNYEHFQKELMAIAWAMRHFDKWLKFVHFYLITDLKAAEDILERSPGHRRLGCKREERFAATIREYDHKMIFLPGNLNVSDCLSRMADHSSSELNDIVAEIMEDDDSDISESCNSLQVEICMLCSVNELKSISCQVVREETLKDAEIQEVLKVIRECGFIPSGHPLKASFSDANGKYHEEDGLLMKVNAIVLPKSLRLRAVHIAHRTHMGVEGTYQYLRRCVWWPRITVDVSQELAKCEICRQVDARSKLEPMRRTIMPVLPWTALAMDFFDAKSASGKYVQVFGIVDYTSRFIWLKLVNNKTAETVIGLLNTLLSLHGIPDSIRSDGGPPFGSKALALWFEEHGIIHEFSTPYHSQGNGQIEREFFRVKQVLQAATLDKKSYKEALEEHQLLHNTTTQASTGESPMLILNGREGRSGLPISDKYMKKTVNMEVIQQRDQHAKERGKVYQDNYVHAEQSTLQPGDLVWIHRPNKAGKLDTSVFRMKHKILSRNGSELLLKAVDNSGGEFKRDVAQVVPCPKPDENNETAANDEVANEDFQTSKLSQIDLNDLVWVRLSTKSNNVHIDVLPQKYRVTEKNDRSLTLEREDGHDKITRQVEQVIKCPPIDTDESYEQIRNEIDHKYSNREKDENCHDEINGIPISFFPDTKACQDLNVTDTVCHEINKQVAKDTIRRRQPQRKCKNTVNRIMIL